MLHHHSLMCASIFIITEHADDDDMFVLQISSNKNSRDDKFLKTLKEFEVLTLKYLNPQVPSLEISILFLFYACCAMHEDISVK